MKWLLALSSTMVEKKRFSLEIVKEEEKGTETERLRLLRLLLHLCRFDKANDDIRLEKVPIFTANVNLE